MPILSTAQANAAMGWTPAKLRAYRLARAQACRGMADEGACLARVARHAPVTITSGYASPPMSPQARAYYRVAAQRCKEFADEGACLARIARRMPLTVESGIGNYYRSLGDSADGLGQTEGQVASNVINALALVIRDPEGTMRVQGPAIVAAADRHIVGPLVESGVRAATPYILRYAVPALGVLYLLSGAAAYFSFQVLKDESGKRLKPNRRRSRRRRRMGR